MQFTDDLLYAYANVSLKPVENTFTIWKLKTLTIHGLNVMQFVLFKV